MDELWLNSFFLRPQNEATVWGRYFDTVELALGLKITHLDTHDPVRRRIYDYDMEEVGEYIAMLNDVEESRYVFGKTSIRGLNFAIEIWRGDSGFEFSILWSTPVNYLGTSTTIEQMEKLFLVGIEHLAPYYAYVDLISNIKKKKKKSGMAVSFDAELLGVFWITYFGKAYVEFFGKSKFSQLPVCGHDLSGGALLKLTDSPFDCPEQERTCIEGFLGKMSFVDPDYILDKPDGVYALTSQSLLNAQQEN